MYGIWVLPDPGSAVTDNDRMLLAVGVAFDSETSSADGGGERVYLDLQSAKNDDVEVIEIIRILLAFMEIV